MKCRAEDRHFLISRFTSVPTARHSIAHERRPHSRRPWRRAGSTRPAGLAPLFASVSIASLTAVESTRAGPLSSALSAGRWMDAQQLFPCVARARAIDSTCSRTGSSLSAGCGAGAIVPVVSRCEYASRFQRQIAGEACCSAGATAVCCDSRGCARRSCPVTPA